MWWSFARHQWRLLASLTSTAAVVIAGVAWLMPNTFARGLVVGVGVTATIGALTLLTTQATGTAHMTAGATAEQWTSSELRALRSAGWRTMNHFAFEDWDIDHILVGPGGVIAVEAKWSHRDWRSPQSRPWLTAAVEQAEANARTLRLWLKALDVAEVSPVGFCWSAHALKPRRAAAPARADEIRADHLRH